MIDLQPTLRSFLLNDSTFSSYLSTYNGSRAIFTRRPVPPDASYPLAIISPLVGQIQNDFIGCGNRQVSTYDVAIYSTNDDPVSYRNVEAASYRLARILHRIPNHTLTMPTGSYFVQTTAIGPFPAPTDDEVKVARVVSVNVEFVLEN